MTEVWNVVVGQELVSSFCPSCGGHVERSYVACPACGFQLKEKCPGCNQTVDRSWRFCPYCQQEQQVKQAL